MLSRQMLPNPVKYFEPPKFPELAENGCIILSDPKGYRSRNALSPLKMTLGRKNLRLTHVHRYSIQIMALQPSSTTTLTSFRLKNEDVDALNKMAELLGQTRSDVVRICLLYTSPSPRDKRQSRMPSSA